MFNKTLSGILSEKDSSRFWINVDHLDQERCMHWIGARDKDGYGVFTVKTVRLLAHRLSWMIAHGPIARNLVIRHSCDTPSCVNPSHLFIGTQAENIADMTQKGRAYKPRGEAQSTAKLTNDKVVQIRQLYNSGGITYKEIASSYGISIPTAYSAITRRTWKHID